MKNQNIWPILSDLVLFRYHPVLRHPADPDLHPLLPHRPRPHQIQAGSQLQLQRFARGGGGVVGGSCFVTTTD